MNPMKMTLASAAVWSLAGIGLAQTSAADPKPVAEGKRTYMIAGCHQCHGTVGQGGVGPRLVPKPMPIEALTAFVRHSPRSMPAYDAQVLTNDELKRIHTYLSSIEASPTVDQIPQLR